MDMANTSVDDRDRWRERIMRALKDLRGDESAVVGRMRRDEICEEAAVEPSKY